MSILKKKSSFWQFFDIQMAIFRRVSLRHLEWSLAVGEGDMSSVCVYGEGRVSQLASDGVLDGSTRALAGLQARRCVMS